MLTRQVSTLLFSRTSSRSRATSSARLALTLNSAQLVWLLKAAVPEMVWPVTRQTESVRETPRWEIRTEHQQHYHHYNHQ